MFTIIHPVFSQIRFDSSGMDEKNQFVKHIGEGDYYSLVKRGDYFGVMGRGSSDFIVQPEFEEIEGVQSFWYFKSLYAQRDIGDSYTPIIARKNGKYGVVIIQESWHVDTLIPFQNDRIEYECYDVSTGFGHPAHLFYFQKSEQWGLIVPNYYSIPVPLVEEKPVPIFADSFVHLHDADLCGYIVKTDGKYGILANQFTEDNKYIMALSNVYDDIQYYNPNPYLNYLLIKKDGKCGCYFEIRNINNINNSLELPFEDARAKTDRGGYFAVKYEGKWGFVDYSFDRQLNDWKYNWIVKPVYDEVEDIDESYGSTNVWKKGKKYRLVWDNHKHKYIEHKYK